MISHQTGKAFRNLLLNVCRIWSWRMDYDGKLIETNCESPNLFFRIMLEDSHREALMASQPGGPCLCSTGDRPGPPVASGALSSEGADTG